MSFTCTAETSGRHAESVSRILSAMATRRGDALCACLVLIGSEAGYENAHDKDAFLTFCHVFLAWSFDLGADAKTHRGGGGS